MKTILVVTYLVAVAPSIPQQSELREVRKEMGTEERCQKKKAEIERFYQKAQKYRTGYKEITVRCEAHYKSKGV